MYAADVSEGVVTWTPSEGVVKTNIPPETAIEVGASGTLVTWTDAQPVMQIQSGDRTDNYEVPGGIRGLSLSPEAQVVAVIWGAQDASGFFHSYLSVVSPSTSQPLPSPLPTPAPTPTLSPTVPPQQETSDDGTNWSVVTFDPLMTMAIGSVTSMDGGFLAGGHVLR